MKEGDNQRNQGESEPRLRKARALRWTAAVKTAAQIVEKVLYLMYFCYIIQL